VLPDCNQIHPNPYGPRRTCPTPRRHRLREPHHHVAGGHHHDGDVPAPDVPAPDAVATRDRLPAPTETEPSGTCSASGARISLGPVDGAMGQRFVRVILTNCGHQPYRVDNYPALTPLDEQHRPARIGVRHDSSDSIGPYRPQRLVLKPGQTAEAALSWRNTVIDPSDIATASYLTVTARPGETPTTLPLAIDAGTTHRLAITGWRAPGTIG
jgi:hypothetical protein